MVLAVGTSGWQYGDWKGAFYPPGADLLPFYATRFATVEVNNSFYRLPPRVVFEQWRGRTPAGFEFAVKMSRYLTHIKRLRDPAEPVSRLLSHADGLGDKLGPILLQLPPTLPFDAELLHGVLSRFPRSARIAVEPRHPTWFSGQVRKALEKHDAALCWADRSSRPITPLWRTTGFGYLRLHEGRAKPWPHYGRGALASWLDRITEAFGDPLDAPVYVYFNNDPGCAAVENARTFAALARRRGIPVTRAA